MRDFMSMGSKAIILKSPGPVGVGAGGVVPVDEPVIGVTLSKCRSQEVISKVMAIVTEANKENGVFMFLAYFQAFVCRFVCYKGGRFGYPFSIPTCLYFRA